MTCANCGKRATDHYQIILAGFDPDALYCSKHSGSKFAPVRKLYAERLPWKLEPHYCAHIQAMTAEGLHDKSAIAAELAWRDAEIARLCAALAECSRAGCLAGARPGASTMTAAKNWRYVIECKDCNAAFDVESVTHSIDRLEGGRRIAALTIPNECPKCRNLKVLKGGADEKF